LSPAGASRVEDILDRVRREPADDLLGDRDNTLAEIAFVLGFSDASAFHRAYVRWMGDTPAAHRRWAVNARVGSGSGSAGA
jgi:AraC-like DNA-binding protein